MDIANNELDLNEMRLVRINKESMSFGMTSPVPTTRGAFMNTDQIIGNAKDATGKVQDSFGAATGNTDWQAEGKSRQLEGKLQEQYGQAVDCARNVTADKPFTALAVAGGIGFVLGVLLSRS